MATRGAPPKKVEAWATQYRKAKRVCNALGHTNARAQAAAKPGASAARMLAAPMRHARTGARSVDWWSGGTGASFRSVHRRSPSHYELHDESNPSTWPQARHTTGRPVLANTARQDGNYGHGVRARPWTAPLVKEGVSESWRVWRPTADMHDGRGPVRGALSAALSGSIVQDVAPGESRR